MKRIIMMMALLITASFMLGSCDQPVANGTASKPTNAANSTAPAVDKAAVEAEVRKVMDDFTAVLNKGDAAALDRMYSDEYNLIDQDGVAHTKSSRLETIKSGKIKWEGLKFSDLKIKTHPAGDGAIIIGRATGKTTIDGKTEERNSMVTWVMGKTKDKGWQFMSAQITDIKAGAAKPEDAKADDKETDDKPANTATEKN